MGVTGIGGFFFRAADPDLLRRWYAEHLGVGAGEHGAWDTAAGPSVFAPFPQASEQVPAGRAWMLDLRVDGLDDLLAGLRAAGVEVMTDPEWDVPGVGRFARLHDPEGNPVELWEPDPEDDAAHDEVHRLYGPWARRSPQDAEELLNGYPGRWWVAGGQAVEAFTGVHREHADLDLSVARDDVPLLRRHLVGRLDAWAADRGTLRPLVDGDDDIPPTCENLWLRASGAEPWEYDVILMSTTPETWTYKRDARITRPLDDVLWVRDGTSYLRPGVQLLHKAPGLRPKDQADFDACRGRLDDGAARWLREALTLAHPGHPWIDQL